MTEQEFEKKWEGISIYSVSEERVEEFVEDLFKTFEYDGFRETFESPYITERKYNGLSFKVIRRCDKSECDVESMPMWKIKLENGVELTAFPEEICKAYDN